MSASGRAAAVERVAQWTVLELRASREARYTTTDPLFRADVLRRVKQILAGEVLPRHENPDD